MGQGCVGQGCVGQVSHQEEAQDDVGGRSQESQQNLLPNSPDATLRD